MMYKEKYLKYKNKYLELKNKKGGSAMVTRLDEYQSTLDNLINNDDVVYFLNKILDMVTLSLQPQKDIIVSDKILIKLFGIERIDDLINLERHINIIGPGIYYYKLNPEQIFDQGFNKNNISFYKDSREKLRRMIKFKLDDEPKIIHLKCLILSIKNIEKLDTNTLLLPKNVVQKNEIIERYKLFGTFDKDVLDSCKANPPYEAVRVPKIIGTVTKIDPKTGEVILPRTFQDAASLEEDIDAHVPHFIRPTNIPGKNATFLKDEYFFENITNMLKNGKHTLRVRFSTVPKTTSSDIITLGRVSTNLGDFILNIKYNTVDGGYAIFESDDPELLNFISKNKISRKGEKAKYNFVKDTIKQIPAILSDDTYRYNFEERLDLPAFKFYKLIYSKIYELLTTKQIREKPGEISSVFCNICRIFTTSTKININCSQCKKLYCRMCSKEPHPFRGCDDILSRKDREAAEEKFTSCPMCREVWARETDCFHMRCGMGTTMGCGTQYCDFCGELWDKKRGFDHLYENLCPIFQKYPKLIEYNMLGRGFFHMNTLKKYVILLKNYPKLLQYVIDNKLSIEKIADTKEKFNELKIRFRNDDEISEPPGSTIAAGGGSAAESGETSPQVSSTIVAGGGSAADEGLPNVTIKIDERRDEYKNRWNNNNLTTINSTHQQEKDMQNNNARKSP